VRAAARGASGLPPERRRRFPAAFRLKRRADFQRVYRHGVRVTGQYLVLFLLAAEGQEGRFGVTASRRVGGAVVRSRCKRRLRELYRVHRPAIDRLPNDIDVVANATRGCATASWDDLEREFVDCVQRAIALAANRDRGAARPRRP
jgi:ribonuclease P protein component